MESLSCPPCVTWSIQSRSSSRSLVVQLIWLRSLCFRTVICLKAQIALNGGETHYFSDRSLKLLHRSVLYSLFQKTWDGKKWLAKEAPPLGDEKEFFWYFCVLGHCVSVFHNGLQLIRVRFDLHGFSLLRHLVIIVYDCGSAMVHVHRWGGLCGVASLLPVSWGSRNWTCVCVLWASLASVFTHRSISWSRRVIKRIFLLYPKPYLLLTETPVIPLLWQTRVRVERNTQN